VWPLATDHIQSIAARGGRVVTIDLQRVPFVDSAGAGLMVRLKRWADAQQVEVRFTRAPANVRNVLRLTRIADLLEEAAP
jgi:anti-anti-sigma factor